MHWIVICPVDSTIQRLNNPGLVNSGILLTTGLVWPASSGKINGKRPRCEVGHSMRFKQRSIRYRLSKKKRKRIFGRKLGSI